MGELAAVITAICWALVSLFFTSAGKEVGSVTANRVRLLIAPFLLMAAHLLLEGRALPLEAGIHRWLWLGLSGVVGLVVADSFLLQAFVYIGARLSMLLFASVPIISTLIAWTFLGEQLSPTKILGIFVTVSGIAMVVLERSGSNNSQTRDRKYVLGILCGFGAAIGEASALVLAKKGILGGYAPLSGVVIRVVSAAVVMWAFTLITGKARQTVRRAVNNRRALRGIMLGTITGPLLGFWFALFAIQNTYVGTAATLMSLPPVILLGIGYWFYKEPVSKQALVGTMLSIVGCAVIFLV